MSRSHSLLVRTLIIHVLEDTREGVCRIGNSSRRWHGFDALSSSMSTTPRNGTCTSLGVSLYLSSNTTLQIRCFCCKNSEIYRHWNLPQGTRKSVAFMRDRFLFQPRGNHMMKDARFIDSVIPRPVRGAAYCTQCRRLLNRDENAAMNIAYVLVKYVRHGVLRPPHLSRN